MTLRHFAILSIQLVVCDESEDPTGIQTFSLATKAPHNDMLTEPGGMAVTSSGLLEVLVEAGAVCCNIFVVMEKVCELQLKNSRDQNLTTVRYYLNCCPNFSGLHCHESTIFHDTPKSPKPTLVKGFVPRPPLAFPRPSLYLPLTA